MRKRDTVLLGESEVQNNIAPLMEEQRYARPYCFAYHCDWVQRMASMLPSRGSILDAGCGTGILLQVMPTLKPRVICMDLSWEMLQRARKRTSKLLQASAQRLPFRDAAFDCIFSRSLFHHLHSIDEGLKEAARVLKPGGTLVLADTHKSLLSAVPRTLAKRGKHFSNSHKDLGYRNFLSKIEMYFEVSKVSLFGYIAYPLLGFPDIWNPLRFLPFKKTLAHILIRIDRVLASLPVIKLLAFGIIICAINRQKRSTS